MTARPLRGALYAAFALSGGAALVYESLWSRYLGLFLGHSAHAQVLVLTVFLGGMAVGAALTGWRSSRILSPLLWYAGVELVVALFGFLFHQMFGGVSGAAYDHIFPALRESPALLAAAKSLAAAALILPQSILLGATFPLMSAGILRWMADRSTGVLGWLYASNSLGAAVGVLVAGFYLVGRFGFQGTLAVAATLNVIVAAVAVLVHVRMRRTQRVSEPARPSETSLAVEPDAREPRLATLLLVVAFGTAVASFAYEIAWIRMLALVLGSATHAFELMLSAFIFGLGLGALWIALRGDRIRDALRALAIVQCVMGAMAAATLPLYVASFGWTVDLMRMFARTAEGYVGFTVARYAICLAIMLPATICAGMTLPLVTRILYRSGAHEGAIGEVYGANTAGSIIGVQLAALVLLPVLGLKFLLVGAALTDIALGVALLWLVRPSGLPSRLTFAVPMAAVALVIVGAWTSSFDPRVTTGGAYRTGRMLDPSDWTMLYHRDGRTATVSVRRSKQGHLVLATNGKPDASLSRRWFSVDSLAKNRPPLQSDEQTQLLLPIMALAHRPSAQVIGVIGHGSGMTSQILLGAPHARQVTTIEIEPEMVRASMTFYPFNRRVFEDSKSHIVIDDARAFFARTTEPFDLIVSEPSNPWVSGVSGLFTKEFYARIRQNLGPEGIFAQWLQLYEINDALVRSVLAALQSAFPHYEIYIVGQADIVVIATNGNAMPPPDWSVVKVPAIQHDLSRVAELTPEALTGLHLVGSRLLEPFVRTAQANSDFAPVLDLESERARYIDNTALGIRMLKVVSFDFVSALSGSKLPLSTSPEPAVDGPRLRLRAASVRVRAGKVPESTTRDADVLAALQRRRNHDATVAGGRPPLSWQLWTTELGLIDRDIHAGSAGANDETLYAPLEEYLRRTSAPPPARHAVQFLRATNRWDFAAAAPAARELILRHQRGESWVQPDYLRDAAVTAHLMIGDPMGAMRIFYALQGQTKKDASGAFRSQFLLTQISHALVRAQQKGALSAER
jgi:spermidine synthase